jgi:Rrf2 family nitric oxide-sensitive transcriptional repressor
MQLKSYTDYALRVLLYLGIHPDRLVTIAEVAGVFGISRNHLMKVAQKLSVCGFVRSVPGKKGGMALARAPEAINLGEVVRKMESDFDLVECFRGQKNGCCIQPACLLQGVFRQATEQFLAALDRYTLRDILANREALSGLVASAAATVSWSELRRAPSARPDDPAPQGEGKAAARRVRAKGRSSLEHRGDGL